MDRRSRRNRPATIVGEARDPDQRGTDARPRAEPPFEGGRERDRATAERDEPRRHHVRVVRVLRRQTADVLVPDLVLVLTSLSDAAMRP